MIFCVLKKNAVRIVVGVVLSMLSGLRVEIEHIKKCFDVDVCLLLRKKSSCKNILAF